MKKEQIPISLKAEEADVADILLNFTAKDKVMTNHISNAIIVKKLVIMHLNVGRSSLI